MSKTPLNKASEISPQISVADFIRKAPPELALQAVAGAGGAAARRIVSSRIQKLGLALAGFSHYIHPGRLQIVGQSEISYLDQLDSLARRKALENLDLKNICGLLITKGLKPPPELTELAEECGLPVMITPQLSSSAIRLASDFLQEELAPQITLHGVMMGMYGLGVLLLGESGIGKSECALDLIARGHRLVADDMVAVKRIGDRVDGFAPELSREHLEIRGLGILNIRDLFGIAAIGRRKPLSLCIRLQKWSETAKIDRLGLDQESEDVLGVNIPLVVLPVSPGRNTSTLVETAVRLQLLRMDGYDASRKFFEKHTEILKAAAGES
jgi:HPr kinase/phosphorylase